MPSPSTLERLGDVRVVARVALPDTPVTLGQLAQLAPGAVIRLDLPAFARAELKVNGLLLAEGELVTSGGRRAFVFLAAL